MIEIVRAPIGAGKTQAALDALVETLRAPSRTGGRFAKVWALLATRRQEDSFRGRLVEHEAGAQRYFNVEFFNFYDLYHRILAIASVPTRFLAEPARLGLLRALITELRDAGALPLYGDIAHTPGFAVVVAGLIAELKQNEVAPATYSAAAHTARDRELAAIYSAYQDALQGYALVDREGEGWLALALLQERAALCADLDLLIVDGYDQFTPVQARLIGLLAGRAQRALLTLTIVPGREATIGRRFEDALATLSAVAGAGIPRVLAGETDSDAHAPRHPHLRGLIDGIFRLPAVEPLPVAAGERSPVAFIEAPDKVSEAAAVLRQVKRLLLNGAAPESILLALRDWAGYAPHLRALSEAYGLPLAMHYGESLAENPLIAALFDALRLHERGFPRRQLLDVLRSPYIRAPGLGAAQVDQLERISAAFTVSGGADAWLDAILQRAHKPTHDDFGEDLPPILATRAEAEALAAALDSFFDALTPWDEAHVANYAAWLEDLIGPDPGALDDDDSAALEPDPSDPPPGYTLAMLAALRESPADESADAVIARDLIAAGELMRALRGLVAAQTLLAALGEAAPPTVIPWAQFFAHFAASIAAAQVSARPGRGGRVLATTAADARGLPHDHVFVLGLSEGVFPAPTPEDPLYLDSERAALTAAGVPLKTRAEAASDDGLFYELIALPRLSLTLSRPATQDGQPWPESHLWRAARAVFAAPSLTRLRVGATVSPGEAASAGEALLATVDGLAAGTPEAGSAYNWLLDAMPERWAHVRAARAVEAARLAPQVSAEMAHYDGVLRDEALRARLAAQFGPQRAWSATQFNEYGASGYRFFARRLLKLEAQEEPEAGMDVLQRGALLHRILEMTYRRVLGAGLAIRAENADAALAILDEEARDILATAPDDFNFRPTPLWPQERAGLAERLRRAVRADFSDASPVSKYYPSAERYPHRLEAAFGEPDGPPVQIRLPGGEAVRLRGVIDRIDRLVGADGGEAFVVMDYKSGTTPYRIDDMAEGRNYQMLVYLLAAEVLLPGATVLGGLFWHLPNHTASGPLKFDDRETLDAALSHLERYLGQIRAGDFVPLASKPEGGKCVRYCEYRQLCRTCGLFRR